jgi:hypothetical protein
MSNVISSLSVSTVHVPSSFKNDLASFITADGEYTTLVYVPCDLNTLLDDLSSDLDHVLTELPSGFLYIQNIFQLATDEGCSYVMLDSSGDEYDVLARFDWE